MTNYAIGKGKPPKHTQFPPGKSGNPKGRPPKPPVDKIAEVARKFFDAPKHYRVGGKARTASTREVRLRRLAREALLGNISAAAELLRERNQAQREKGGTSKKVIVTDCLPDYPGMTSKRKAPVTSGKSHDQPLRTRSNKSLSPDVTSDFSKSEGG